MHVDDVSDTNRNKLLTLLATQNLVQHVNTPTHVHSKCLIQSLILRSSHCWLPRHASYILSVRSYTHLVVERACSIYGTSYPTLYVISLCLQTGSFLTALKQALVQPRVKSSALDPDQLKSYRPISNLPYVSKLLNGL